MNGFRYRISLALMCGVVATATALAMQGPAPAQGAQNRAQTPRPAAAGSAEVGILPVQGKVYMINLGEIGRAHV